MGGFGECIRMRLICSERILMHSQGILMGETIARGGAETPREAKNAACARGAGRRDGGEPVAVAARCQRPARARRARQAEQAHAGGLPV